MTTIRERVVDVLARLLGTRNDDMELYVEVLKDMKLAELMDDGNLPGNEGDGKLISIRVEDVSRMPSFEAVRRRRQEIQNDEGKLIPTDPDVLGARGFYRVCPRERLLEEDQPNEIIEAACRRCPKLRTDACHVFGAAIAVVRA